MLLELSVLLMSFICHQTQSNKDRQEPGKPQTVKIHIAFSSPSHPLFECLLLSYGRWSRTQRLGAWSRVEVVLDLALPLID